jgi:predicted peptidase
LRKRIVGIAMAIIALAGISGCGEQAVAEPVCTDLGAVSVTVNTTVRKTGQYPESFVATFENDVKDKTLDPALFKMTGKAGFWGSDDVRDFECSFSDVSVDKNSLTLVPADFPEKYFYVKEFTVTCAEHPEYDFSSADVTKTLTPVADDFETINNKGSIEFDYHLFTPETNEVAPIVIVFHGYGDTNNLLTYKTAVEWAEPENQKVRPCYVLAPVINDKDYFNATSRNKIYEDLKTILDGMVADNKVNPDKIYVMGNSFGGIATLEFCEKYPETVSAAMALCPALTYAPNVNTGLSKMVDVPVWFAHAAGDNTIPVTASQTAVAALTKLGATELKYTEYTDEQMNAAGADGSPDSTYSYHHVELAVMEDDAYQEWMFSH